MAGTPLYFEGQVAGHASLLCYEEGTLAKPCTATERQFYRMAQGRPMARYMPQFRGDHPNPPHEHISPAKPGAPPLSEVILLQNLLVGYRAPCILDLKMGTKLYDWDATDEKRDRMERLAASTTNGSVGMRVSGMRLFRPTVSHTSAVTADPLGDGVGATPPPAPDTPPAVACTSLPSNGAATKKEGENNPGGEIVPYDRNYGKTLDASTVHLAFVEYTKFVQPVPERLALLTRMQALVEEFTVDAMALKGTFVGSSLLFVFDALASSPSVSLHLHWIDFAHSRLRDDDGPEEQLLFGLRNCITAIAKATQHVAKVEGGVFPHPHDVTSIPTHPPSAPCPQVPSS